MERAVSEHADLKTAVQNWLEKSGYPFEMEVANAFREADFGVSQAVFYADPETKQQREIDVVASDSVALIKAGHTVYLRFVVECKTSHDKPWVMFTSRSRAATRGGTSNMGMYSLMGRAKGLTVRAILSRDRAFDSLPLFDVANDLRPAYGMVQALGKSDGFDASYSAQMQAVKAAIAILDDDKRVRPLRLRFRPESATMVCPVIVLDGPLFLARLNETGNGIELIERERHFLAVSNPEVTAQMSFLTVVTRQGLAKYVSDAAQARNTMFAVCKSNASTIEKALKDAGS
jgi:hypothetical protein